MKIAVIGASGWLGNTIARTAISRGHEVTGFARHPERIERLGDAPVAEVDATDPRSVLAASAGNDVVVVAVGDRSNFETVPGAATAAVAALTEGAPRVIFLGGGGSLLDPEGRRFVDDPDFPEAYRGGSLAQTSALAIFRAEGTGLEWTYVSPPPHDLTPGDARGGYRAAAGDVPVRDATGASAITSGDLAAVVIDEAEKAEFIGKRFTAAYV